MINKQPQYRFYVRTDISSFVSYNDMKKFDFLTCSRDENHFLTFWQSHNGLARTRTAHAQIQTLHGINSDTVSVCSRAEFVLSYCACAKHTHHGSVRAEFVPCWVCIRIRCLWLENRIDLIILNTPSALILINISVCSYDKIRLQYHPTCQNINWFRLTKADLLNFFKMFSVLDSRMWAGSAFRLLNTEIFFRHS